MDLLHLPETMPVAVYRAPGEIAVEARPVPRPEPGRVLVEISHCGVCGSDLHIMVEGWGRPGFVGGHEFSGRVVALGDGVSEWAPGDLVVGGPSPRCGTCRRCQAGQPSQCERRSEMSAHDTSGGFSGYVTADARALVAVPGGLDPRHAALAEPLAVALHGITRSGVGPGDSVMVLGAGPIGALTVAALVAAGHGPVTVVEPVAARRELALRLGATSAVPPDELEVFGRHQPDRMAAGAVDVVLECSGKKAAMEAGFQQLNRGGRMVLVGAGMEAPTFDSNRLLLNELTVTGSFVYDADGFERALDLLAGGAVPADVLIEPGDVGLDGLGAALAGLSSGTIAGKVMVVPRTGDDVRAQEEAG